MTAFIQQLFYHFEIDTFSTLFDHTRCHLCNVNYDFDQSQLEHVILIVNSRYIYSLLTIMLNFLSSIHIFVQHCHYLARFLTMLKFLAFRQTVLIN